MNGMTRWMAVGLSACAFAPLWATDAVAEDITEFESYVVKNGDTCTSISEAFFGDKRRYDLIHAYNDLSADNYACLPGRTLKIAKIPALPDALVAEKAGDVRARGPAQQNWNEALAGMDLYSAWRLNTLQKARAEIAFQDTSTLLMSPETLVIIYGQSREKTRVEPARTVLESGRLRSRLDELAGVKVESPSSTATLGSGQAQVTVESDGLTRVENHRGKPAEVTGKAGGKVAVKQGMGTRVKPNAQPEPPRPLPQTPVWLSAESFTVGFEGIGATVSLRWEPVAQAKAYYVELARDPRGIDVVESVFVPADRTELHIKNTPPGTYFAVVSSVDADKFESVPSLIHHVRSATVSLPAENLTVDASGTYRVVLGTAVRPPKNMVCRTTPNDTFSATPIFATPGDTALECQVNQSVGAQKVFVDVPTTRRADDRKLSTAQARVVYWTFDPAPPGEVAFTAEGGEVAQAANTPQGYAIKVKATHDQPVTLVATFGQVELGRHTYEVEAQGQAAAVPPDIYQLQLLGGYAYYDGIEGADVGPLGASLHVQGALLPTKYLGLAASVAAGQYDAAILDWRTHIMVGLFESESRPYVSAGAGGLLIEDHLTTYNLSAGVMPRLDDHFGWQFDAGALFIPQNNDLNAIPQARVGFWWSFK